MEFNFHSIPSFFPSLPVLQPPDGTYKKFSRDAIFTVCSHTFTLFLSRKTSVIVKILQISFVCLCVPFLRRSLHFSVRVYPLLFHFFVICTSVLAFPRGMISLFLFLFQRKDNYFNLMCSDDSSALIVQLYKLLL